MVAIETTVMGLGKLLPKHKCDVVVELGRKGQESVVSVALDIIERTPSTQVGRANSIIWHAGKNDIGVTSINPHYGHYRLNPYTAAWLMRETTGFELLQDHAAPMASIVIAPAVGDSSRELKNSLSHIIQELFHDPDHPQLWCDEIAIAAARAMGRAPFDQ